MLSFCSFQVLFPGVQIFFFLPGFSFTDTDDSQDSRGREGTIFYSTLPTSSTGSLTFRHLFATLDVIIFLIASLVFTRLLLHKIFHLIELPFDWLMMWHQVFVCFRAHLILAFLLQQSETWNWWIRTCMDYHHPCITSELNNGVR